jgi:uncharacterized cysteine cluster protein YcgN (CxxCxxCC family)
MIDYENDCRRCGECCSPFYDNNGEFIRLKSLKCKYQEADNTCSVYGTRKEKAGCVTAEEGGLGRPENCVFGGWVRMIQGEEETEFIKNLPIEFMGLGLSGNFVWRKG